MTAPASRAPALRVAQVLPFAGVGGTEHSTLRLIQALRPHGIESVAFCREDAADVSALFRDHGVDVLTWRRRKHDLGRAADLAGLFELGRGLLGKRVDLVALADVAAATRPVARAARALRRPLLCHVRNRNARLPAHLDEGLAQVARFVFMSRHTWRTFAHAVPEERGVVVYDGVEPDPALERPGERERARAELRAELGLPPDTPLCGMVARVEPQKDFATLARAAARVVAQHPRAHFVVIGGYDRTAEQRAHMPLVRRWMEAAGVSAHVHFLGFREDVPRLLLGCDVALLVTHWEGLPLVLWEAMSVATPIVATAVDGVPEAIVDGETGLLVGHEDDAQLAGRLLSLLRDEPRARALGRAGLEHVRRSFSRERFGAQVAALYRELAR